jgi:hypothetical protein
VGSACADADADAGTGTKAGSAPQLHVVDAAVKSYGRIVGKMVAADDHRYQAKPRPGLNIDIVQVLVFPVVIIAHVDAGSCWC